MESIENVPQEAGLDLVHPSHRLTALGTDRRRSTPPVPLVLPWG